VHTVIGSSLGGMQALQFVVEFPDIAKRMINISSTSHTSPGTVAIRRIQRLAVISDPKYHNGKYHNHNTWPSHGMKVARTVGLLSYRSVTEFNDRFGWKPQPPYNAQARTFEVERWLDEKTEPFCSTYDPNCYLLLSRCMDLMDIGMTWPSHKEALSRVKAKCLILGANTDTLIYPKEQTDLYHQLIDAGVDTECYNFDFSCFKILHFMVWINNCKSSFVILVVVMDGSMLSTNSTSCMFLLFSTFKFTKVSSVLIKSSFDNDEKLPHIVTM